MGKELGFWVLGSSTSSKAGEQSGGGRNQLPDEVVKEEADLAC